MSNQCMALVRDNCLVPTKDAHELGYIRESSDKQYVPDVFYKVGNKLFFIFFFFSFYYTIFSFNTSFISSSYIFLQQKPFKN